MMPLVAGELMLGIGSRNTILAHLTIDRERHRRREKQGFQIVGPRHLVRIDVKTFSR